MRRLLFLPDRVSHLLLHGQSLRQNIEKSGSIHRRAKWTSVFASGNHVNWPDRERTSMHRNCYFQRSVASSYVMSKGRLHHSLLVFTIFYLFSLAFLTTVYVIYDPTSRSFYRGLFQALKSRVSSRSTLSNGIYLSWRLLNCSERFWLTDFQIFLLRKVVIQECLSQVCMFLHLVNYKCFSDVVALTKVSLLYPIVHCQCKSLLFSNFS